MNPEPELSTFIARAWDDAIRDFLVKSGVFQAGFDPRDHASFIAANGRFQVHNDDSRTFLWQGDPVLCGTTVRKERSIFYEIKKLKK